MSKKPKYSPNENLKKYVKKDDSYKQGYTLHKDAIDALVTANKENTPKVDENEIKAYKHDKFEKIPVWLKALFIKFWFNGAVCFFFIWGLGMYITGFWDLVLVTGLAMGAVTDILVNNLFFFFGDEKYKKWMLIPVKKFWTLFVYLIYSCVVMVVVVYFYEGVNLLFNPQNTGFNVEPITFGLIYLAVDLIFVWLKNLVVKIINDAREKAAL